MAEPSDDKLHAVLCSDHFERLCAGNPCEACPSRLENKERGEAVSRLFAEQPERIGAALQMEHKILRRSYRQLSEEVSKLSDRISGNGSLGLASRVAVIEAVLEQSRKSNSTWLVVIGLIASTLIGAVSIGIAVVANGG